MQGQRIVTPKSLQKEVVHKFHEGHQGITRCRSRAQISVWWPGLTQKLTSFIQNVPQTTDLINSHLSHPIFQTTHGNK